ncbi:MAG: hypothetical protein JJU29_21020 [Verrucomicrobia bacterium]|nr:hypothetical protein [Verrucomicrobiota bacterium]MCH8513857.1 hypothetical protein [Kiritimatiellia bacterium]
METLEKLIVTLEGLYKVGLWEEAIQIGMSHLEPYRHDRRFKELLGEAFCKEILRVAPKRAVQLDEQFRSLRFPPDAPLSHRWQGCRNKALGRTDYAENIHQGWKALETGQTALAMLAFQKALRLAPFCPNANQALTRAIGKHLQQGALHIGAYSEHAGLLETLTKDLLPRIPKPSVAHSEVLETLTKISPRHESGFMLNDVLFDWPLPFWQLGDTVGTVRHPWSLLGHVLHRMNREVGILVGLMQTDLEDPVQALPDQGRGIISYALELEQHLPDGSPAWLRLSDFHRSWGCQNMADDRIYAYMIAKPDCPLGWLHLASSFYYPHKLSLYLSGLCKAALLLDPRHSLYTRVHILLAMEFWKQKECGKALEEYRIARAGRTVIPWSAIPEPFRRFLLSLGECGSQAQIPDRMTQNYQREALDAEKWLESASPFADQARNTG